jgi:hypothetical protein
MISASRADGIRNSDFQEPIAEPVPPAVLIFNTMRYRILAHLAGRLIALQQCTKMRRAPF